MENKEIEKVEDVKVEDLKQKGDAKNITDPKLEGKLNKTDSGNRNNTKFKLKN